MYKNHEKIKQNTLSTRRVHNREKKEEEPTKESIEAVYLIGMICIDKRMGNIPFK
jgi:hypothetical protein